MDARTATAAHRFGLAEASLAGLGADPLGWLSAQLGPAETPTQPELASTSEALEAHRDFQRARRRQRRDASSTPGQGAAPRGGKRHGADDEVERFLRHFRQRVHEDLRARLSLAATSTRPLAERLAMFWSNHFTVSMLKATVRGLAGPFEREAIRPHLAGRFETLLRAATLHPAMLRYLDNDRSAGPHSQVVRELARRRDPRVTGLNENLARELLELHTLGVAGGGAAYGGWGGYTQADVTELARLLTGWRVDPNDPGRGSHFDARWHEPGPKTVLGRRYAEGPDALDACLRDLAAHPSTARFLAFKLARHFVADQPAPDLVAGLARRYLDSGGDLTEVMQQLLASPAAWDPAPSKLRTPQEFVIASVRLLGLGERAFERTPDAGISTMGQVLRAAPSPAGWPDEAEQWLGPDAVWKRIEWATQVAARVGGSVDARALAEASLGPRLGQGTARQIRRAADRPQALALLLLAPEFQRR